MDMEKDDRTLNDDYEKAKTWSIIYNANGGSNAPPSQTVNVGEYITITSSKPTRSGYTFLGWSTWNESPEPEAMFTPGYSYKSDYDLTLYAVWREVPKKHSPLHIIRTLLIPLLECQQIKQKQKESEFLFQKKFQLEADMYLCIGLSLLAIVEHHIIQAAHTQKTTT